MKDLAIRKLGTPIVFGLWSNGKGRIDVKRLAIDIFHPLTSREILHSGNGSGSVKSGNRHRWYVKYLSRQILNLLKGAKMSPAIVKQDGINGNRRERHSGHGCRN
jgi:hypothetical protein